MMPGMDAPRCPLCDSPATIEQGASFACPDHATDKAALRARLGILEAKSDPTSPELLEADRIELRIGELDGHAR